MTTKPMTLHEKVKHYESEANIWKTFALDLLRYTIVWSDWEVRPAFAGRGPDYEMRHGLLPSGRVIIHCRYKDVNQAGTGGSIPDASGLYHSIRKTIDDKETRDLTEKYFAAKPR